MTKEAVSVQPLFVYGLFNFDNHVTDILVNFRDCFTFKRKWICKCPSLISVRIRIADTIS